MTSEGKVKAKVKAWLKKHKIPNWSIIPSPFGGSTGMADLCCILPKSGKWLAIEVKAEGKSKNVTANQLAFIGTINEHNGYAFVVSCEAELVEVEKSLRDIGEI